MPRISSVYALPIEVRQALIQRLIKNGYGNFAAISELLQEEGYQISKSALHRFAQELKQTKGDTIIAGEIDLADSQAEMMIDLRMRCLEVASRTDHESPVDLAKIYLNWVVNGG